jgi:membrane protease YdiL (CAAX protease family)
MTTNQDLQAQTIQFIKISSLFYVVMTLVGLVIIYFSGGDMAMFEWGTSEKDAMHALRIVFLTVGILYCLGDLMEFFPDYQDVKDMMTQTLAGLPLWAPPVLGILSGVGEEVLFRGALQPLLGWIPTSIVFGLVHLAPASSSGGPRITSWSLATGVAGLLLGYVFLRTERLLPCILAHACINCFSMYWMIWESQDAQT